MDDDPEDPTGAALPAAAAGDPVASLRRRAGLVRWPRKQGGRRGRPGRRPTARATGPETRKDPSRAPRSQPVSTPLKSVRR